MNAEGMPADLSTADEENPLSGRCNQSIWLAYRDLFEVHLNAEVVSDIRASTNGTTRRAMKVANGK